MIKSATLKKEFATKDEIFGELRKNADKILSLKKAAIKRSGLIGATSKGISVNKLAINPDSIYPVINTTNLVDYCDDLHLPGIWKKSLTEQQGKLYYCLEHELELKNIIAWPNDVKSYTTKLAWSAIGQPYTGSTEALIFEIKKDAIVNEDVADVIDESRPVQNSVSMQYVAIELCMNSNVAEDATYKAAWDKYYPQVANKEYVDAQGYMFAVTEAKIVREGSMVLLGANAATPILGMGNMPEENTFEDGMPPKPKSFICYSNIL